MDTDIGEVEAIISKVHKSLECSICLDILEEPHSTQCNHQFCRKCIDQLFHRRKGKAGVICPLCKAKISKRGLSQNRKLVKVVEAIRNVLASVNEDIRQQGTPLAVVAKTNIGAGNEVSEETPFQGIRNISMLETKDGCENLSKSLKGNFDNEVSELLKTKQPCNTRKSKRIRWSDDTNVSMTNSEHTELFKVLDTANLGRKTRRSKRAAPSLTETNLCDNLPCTNANFDQHTSLRSSAQSDATSTTSSDGAESALEHSDSASRVESFQGVTDKPSEVCQDAKPVENPTKYIVAETPLLPLQENSNDEQPAERNNRPGMLLGKKKTSPFSFASVRAPLKPQDPNIFDFVDDDPLEKSDLYERVKQRRKKEDVKSENVLRSKVVKVVNDVQHDCSSNREECTTRTSRSSKSVYTKPGSDATRQKKPRVRRGKGKKLLKEAWEIDEEKNSQLIDTASTASLTEPLNAPCPNVSPSVDDSKTDPQKPSNVYHKRDENVEACSFESEIKDTPVQPKLATDDSPSENLATSFSKKVSAGDARDTELTSERDTIPSQDNLEASIVYKESLGIETDKPFKHGDTKSSKLLDDSSESDVVPPSVSSSSTPFHGPINPMESPLYKKCNSPTGLAVITSSTSVADVESRRPVNVASSSSIGNHMKSQSNGRRSCRSHEASMNLYSDTRASENTQTITSNSDCSLSIAAAEEPLADDRRKEIEACTDNTLNETSAIDQNVSKNAPESGSYHDEDVVLDTEKEGPSALESAEIIAKEMELEKVSVECEIVDKQSEESRLDELQEQSAGQTIEEADGEDEKGEQTSSGLTPSLCDEELFSQGTYFDDGIPGKNLEDTEDLCCTQNSKGVQNHSMVLEHKVEVANDPPKFPVKSIESSTDDNTQASISILVKQQLESEIDGLKSDTALRPGAFSGEKSITGAIRKQPKVDVFTQTLEEVKVSSACQTEFVEMLGKQSDAGDHAEMISVACQTPVFEECTQNTERDTVHWQKVSKALTMSQACQTVKSSFKSLSGEDYSTFSRDCSIDNVNAASSCTPCKRKVSKVPKDVFEMVRRNIQEAIAQGDSNIISEGINVPVNFTVSNHNIGADTNTESDLEMLEGQTSASIRIERLSFVPVWMTSDDEFSPKDNKTGSILNSERDIRASKRNLLKKFTRKSLRSKGMKNDDVRPPTDKQHDMVINFDPEEEEGAENSKVLSNVKGENIDESEMEGRAFGEIEENIKKGEEMGKDINEIDANDIILPTPPSEILKISTTDVNTVLSKTAKPIVASGAMLDASESSSGTQTKAVDDIDCDSLPTEDELGNGDSIIAPMSSLNYPIYENYGGKPDSADSGAVEAERVLLPVENVAVGNSKGKPLCLKRKSKRQLVKDSRNSSSSKKAKLDADFPLVHEREGSSQECSKAGRIDCVVDCSADIDKNFINSSVACTSPCKASLEKSVESSAHSLDIMVDSLEGVHPQILCSNHSGKIPPQGEQVSKELLKKIEEDSASILEDKAKNDLEIKPFAVLERREDVVVTDEAIAALDTPVCEEVQNLMVDEERAAIEGSAVDGEDFNDSGHDITSSNLFGVGENGPSQKEKFHNTTLDDPDIFAAFAEDDERDLFASYVGEEDEEHGLQADLCSLAEEDLEEIRGSAPGSSDVALNMIECKLDGDQGIHVKRKVTDCAVQDSHNAERERMVAVADNELGAMDSRGTAVYDDKDFLNVVEEESLLATKENFQNSFEMRSYTKKTISCKHKQGNFDSQEIKTDEENLKIDNKCKPDFMALVRECVKGKGNYPKEDESDEETSFFKPGIEERAEEGEVQFPRPGVQNSINQRKRQDCDMDASPPSPSPPPRVKRKRTSPVEAQAALKEIKKLIHSDEDGEGNLRVKEATTLKKPELEFVMDVSRMDKNSSPRKIPCTPSNQQSVDLLSSPKRHHATPKQIPPPNTDQRLSGTPKNSLQGAPIGENSEEVNGSSRVRKSLERGVITTPKLKEEKPLLEKNSRIGRTNVDHTKMRKLPQILVPSRLNKKQMIACKYLASKFNCKFSNSFLRGTTHLIMGTDETSAIDRSAYTYKYLMALINGSWIVSFQWVHACLDSGGAVDESRFEVKGDPSSDQEIVPKYARLSRQRKELPLFHDLSLTLLGDFQSSNMTKDQLVELLERGGAEIFFELPRKIPSKNYLLILDSDNIEYNLKAKFVEANIQPIHYEWITESIINYKIQEPLEFLLEL